MSGLNLRILGIRGVPAAHGGFETFAERLAIYLVDRGWKVTVYCQEERSGPVVRDQWNGVDRVRIPVWSDRPLGTAWFDWVSILDAGRSGELCLTLGYNTALLCSWLRVKGIGNLINMDGIEWKRGKYGLFMKAWFWINERAGAWLGNHLIADNPEIARHLQNMASASRITTIAYGADPVLDASEQPVLSLGLQPRGYLTLIARPEPENSILEVVRTFSRRPRGVTLVVLGRLDESVPYHREVRAAAGPEVRFLGAIYEAATVQSLRFHAVAHIHGHKVGGTNPSLVEALGAGNPVLAHDNPFNRWVAGHGALYFRTEDELDVALDGVLSPGNQMETLRIAARTRFDEQFRWEDILGAYEKLLRRFCSAGQQP